MPKGNIKNTNYKGYNEYYSRLFRSPRAYVQDRARTARVTNDYEKWKRNPNHWDFNGIDTPKNVFKYKWKKQKGNGKGTYYYVPKHRKINWIKRR